MGQKGSKLSEASTEAAESFVKRLAPLGDIKSRKMFGGYGIFHNGTMFALVDSHGTICLKVTDKNRKQFEDAGSARHGKMPYYEVPTEVLEDEDRLREWSQESIQIANSNG